MITLIGCPLRQWDIDRKVEVLNEDITELHFCNQHHCSPKVAKVANGMAAIPNELLQLYQEIDVYGLDANGETVYSCKLDVNARLKPEDYPFDVNPDGPGATPEQLAQIEQNKSNITELSSEIMDKLTTPTTAEVGQTIVVEEVDENGKPIKWKAVDTQADWNQNDETAPNYVKNRPFWTDDINEICILEETTFELQDGLCNLSITQPLEVGQEYIVTIDGNPYNCISKFSNELFCVYIGNITLIGGTGEDTGELFSIAPFDSETELGIALISDVSEHTVSIICMHTEIHKIDEKYLKLPDTVVQVSNQEWLMPIMKLENVLDVTYFINDNYSETFDCTTKQWSQLCKVIYDHDAESKCLICSEMHMCNGYIDNDGSVKLWRYYFDDFFVLIEAYESVLVFNEDEQTVTVAYKYKQIELNTK